MAEGAIIRMRLHSWPDLGGCVGSNIIIPSNVSASEPKIIDIKIEGTPANAPGFSEIDPVTGHQLEDPGVAIEILSSDNKDNAAVGGAVQGVYIIGIDENDELQQLPQAMHAATGTTVVTSTTLWKECFHMFAGLHGTEDMDAEGNITLQDIADNDICIIALTKNESDGSAFKVPDGHCAMLLYAHLKRLAPTAGVYSADEGVRIRILAINALDGETGMVAGDRAINWINMESVGEFIYEAEHKGGEIYPEGTWIHFQHSSKVNLGELYDFHAKFLIWKK